MLVGRKETIEIPFAPVVENNAGPAKLFDAPCTR